jgi:hypothetical protein
LRRSGGGEEQAEGKERSSARGETTGETRVNHGLECNGKGAGKGGVKLVALVERFSCLRRVKLMQANQRDPFPFAVLGVRMTAVDA